MRILRDPQIIRGFIYEEPVKELPSLTHCGEALCCRGHARPPHVHEGFEFLYLIRGRCQWTVAGQIYRQSMGDLFIAFPSESHQTGPKPNPENQHLWLGLNLGKLSPEGRQLARELKRHNLRLLSQCHDVEPLLYAIIGQVMEMRPRRSAVITAVLRAFVEWMRQRVKTEGNPAPRRLLLPYSFPVQKAIAFMHKNMDRRISLADLSGAATLRSIPHFCTQFRWEVGVTPSRHHLQLRMEASREALRQPGATITRTALDFGFSSSQHFSALFHRSFGMTPLEWKNRDS